MPTILNASGGENTSPAGTESFPLTSSKYITLDTVKEFVFEFTLTNVLTYEGNVVVYEGEIVWAI